MESVGFMCSESQTMIYDGEKVCDDSLELPSFKIIWWPAVNILFFSKLFVKSSKLFVSKLVLSIAEVKQIEDSRYSNVVAKADIFNKFNEMNNEKIANVVDDAFKSLNDIDDNDSSSLYCLALDFALTANAYISVAKRILFLTRVYEQINKAKNKEEN